MKRILSATLGAALLVATMGGAAEARGWHGGHGYGHGYGHGWHDNGAGVAIGAGLGILGLAAILSAQHRDDYYAPPPPPPPPPGYYNQGGPDAAYDRGYEDYER